MESPLLYLFKRLFHYGSHDPVVVTVQGCLTGWGVVASEDIMKIQHETVRMFGAVMASTNYYAKY